VNGLKSELRRVRRFLALALLAGCFAPIAAQAGDIRILRPSASGDVGFLVLGGTHDPAREIVVIRGTPSVVVAPTGSVGSPGPGPNFFLPGGPLATGNIPSIVVVRGAFPTTSITTPAATQTAVAIGRFDPFPVSTTLGPGTNFFLPGGPLAGQQSVVFRNRFRHQSFFFGTRMGHFSGTRMGHFSFGR
jgi:hypothetical protein